MTIATVYLVLFLGFGETWTRAAAISSETIPFATIAGCQTVAAQIKEHQRGYKIVALCIESDK